MEEVSKVTVKAVIAYAEQCRVAADRLMAGDPYARPYYPTTAAARRLSSQVGPEQAIVVLRQRSALRDHDMREEAVQAQRALARHARRQSRARKERDAERSGLSAAKRIEMALNRACMISDASVPAIGYTVPSNESKVLSSSGDLLGVCEQIALKAARDIEARVDSATVRDMEAAA